HGGQPGLADQHRVATAVDGDHHARLGVLVLGACPVPRPGPAAGADPDVVLVQRAAGAGAGPAVGALPARRAAGPAQRAAPAGSAPSMAVHRDTKSGTVFAAVSTFSPSTPPPARPSTAAHDS